MPPRALAYSPSGLHLAASGDDEGIKIIDTASNKVFRQLPSTAYTRGLAYDPESRFLASISADGTLAVWDFQNGKAVALKRKACSQADITAPTRLLPSWHPDGGALLAAPGADGSVLLIERLSWEITDELSDGHSGPVHIVVYSSNGLYLASCGQDSCIVIWDTIQRKVINKKVLPSLCCSLNWHPRTNNLMATTEDGQIALWEKPVPEDFPGPCDDPDALAGVKQKGAKNGADSLIDNAASEDESMEEDESKRHYDSESDGSFIENDRHEFRKRRRMESRYMKLDPLSSLPPPQKPIQPGSTKMEAGRRYLSYTPLGSITLRNEKDHNVIEVAFHDTTKMRRRIPLLTDFFGFNLGFLGELGAVYASPESYNANATVLYRPFESWAPNAEWTYSLSKGEEATCIATGESFVAVATTKRHLRLFTQAGIQRDIFDLTGDIVALAAFGNQLAVAHHTSSPTYTGDQCIQITLYNILERQKQFEVPMALTPSAQLAWLGYSEEGMLSTYDTKGVLRVLNPDFGGSWMTIFDSETERKGSESFWVFAVSLKSAEIHCIVCANSPEPTVPSGSTRPVITAVPLHIPVLTNKDDEIAPLESDLIRLTAITSRSIQIIEDSSDIPSSDAGEVAELEALVQKNRVEADRSALKLFAKFVKMDQQVKALEIAGMMHTDAALDGARRLAEHQRASVLASRINYLMERKAEIDAFEQDPPMVMEKSEMYMEKHKNHANWHEASLENNGEQPLKELDFKQNAADNDTLDHGSKNSKALDNNTSDPISKKKKVIGNPFARKLKTSVK